MDVAEQVRRPALAVLADLRALARRVLIHMPAPRMTRLVPEDIVQAHFRAREHNNSLAGAQWRAPRDPGPAGNSKRSDNGGMIRARAAGFGAGVADRLGF